MNLSLQKSSSEASVHTDGVQSHLLNPEEQAGIAQLAYYKAESRDFAPGNEMRDWLEAEQEYLSAARRQ
jgi:hypothetical protein